MDQPHNIAAPDPSGENSYSGAGALSGCMISSNREAMLERELEKQRIREEILMDIVRRREIEAEVKLELVREEMALLRGESSLLSRPIAVDYGITETVQPEQKSASLDQQNRVSLSSGRVGVGLTGQMLERRLAIQDNPMGVNLRDMLPSPADPEEDNGNKGVKALELAKANQQDMVKPYSSLVGMKRKSGFDYVKSESSSKKNTGGLTCTLCNITSTGKKCHQKHLQGRKHRTKALMELESTKAPVEPSVAMMRVVGCSSTMEKGIEMDFGRMWKLDSLKQQFAFICSVCVIGCDTEDILMKHCSGKKHAKHLAASKFWETSASTTLDNKKVKPEELESTEQMDHGAGEVGMGEAAWQRAFLKLADTTPAPDFKNNQNQLTPENQEPTTNVKAVPNILVYTRNKRGVSGSKMADGAGEVDVAVCTSEGAKVEQDG